MDAIPLWFCTDFFSRIHQHVPFFGSYLSTPCTFFGKLRRGKVAMVTIYDVT